ncbi:hypothetical protein SAMN05421693_12913 [Ectothiorhodospira magna]|uniref:Uncharacterized protein n=1 Tax=Ectothiorhodospira magna TaxID=867345 RepID=A0A1H9FRR5_9GAMM|nr:hypothetical protein [Ectothiorhodospira magna]SEQ40631.1 hypothetical protein SAMN05421693_12913 [Ectothiorhodospira magna]
MKDLLTLLESLIGREATVDGIHCEVIEILEAGPRVVVGQMDGDHVIQPDQHGEPHRRVLQTFTLPVLNDQATDIHPVIAAMAGEPLSGRIREALQAEHRLP